jgi:hypothetical protein
VIKKDLSCWFTLSPRQNDLRHPESLRTHY